MGQFVPLRGGDGSGDSPRDDEVSTNDSERSWGDGVGPLYKPNPVDP